MPKNMSDVLYDELISLGFDEYSRFYNFSGIIQKKKNYNFDYLLISSLQYEPNICNVFYQLMKCSLNKRLPLY